MLLETLRWRSEYRPEALDYEAIKVGGLQDAGTRRFGGRVEEDGQRHLAEGVDNYALCHSL